MRGPRIRLVLFVTLALSFVPHRAVGRKKDQAAFDLLAKAKQVMDIRAPENPPFRLAEHLRILTPAHQWVEGDYILMWAARDQWKDELTLPDFHETRVGGQGVVWILGTQRFATVTARQAKSLLDWAALLKISAPDEDKASVRIQSEGQKGMQCLSIKALHSIDRELCFDADQGYLRHESGWQYGPGSAIELSNYIPLGNRMIPHESRAYSRGQLIGEAVSTEAQLLPHVNPSVFTIPTGTEQRITCEDPTPPRPLQKPEPSYTPRARADKVQGSVLLLLDVNEQGSVQDVSVVESLTPDLDKAAAQTIKNKWRFKPAACGGSPIPTEIMVEVSFRLF